jgi:hypothetical protein
MTFIFIRFHPPITHIPYGQNPGCPGVAQGLPGGCRGVGPGKPGETPVNGAKKSVEIWEKTALNVDWVYYL